jgi:hypothetical protein
MGNLERMSDEFFGIWKAHGGAMGTRGSAVGFYRAGLIYNSGGGNRYWNGESITLATTRVGGRKVGC